MKNDIIYVNQTYPLGKIITGKVISHANFGFFLYINNQDILGLVRIVDVDDYFPIDSTMYPTLGSHVKCRILGFDIKNKQLILSTKPSVLEQTNDDYFLSLVKVMFPYGSKLQVRSEEYEEEGMLCSIEGCFLGFIPWQSLKECPFIGNTFDTCVIGYDLEKRRIILDCASL